MNLNRGIPSLAIPGPSVMPPRVLAAMSSQMPNIYEGELVDISNDILARLPGIARTTGHPFMVISNGHGAWLMAIANTLSRGDKILVLESGRFAITWGEMAVTSGVEMEVLPGTLQGPIDPEALEARLAADTDHEIRAIMCVQTDTATSVRNDIAELRAAIDRAGHPALFMVDCIASMACEPFEMDEWGVDVTVAASQKGMMVPPGLGFCWANDKALARYEQADLKNTYVDWEARLNAEAHYELYAGTPPISHLYALKEALDIIDEEGGIEAVWNRHSILAGAVRAAVEAWAAPDGFSFNITDPAARSNAVTTVLTGSIDADQLRDVCEREAGLTLGLGIGDIGNAFRIGHMGHLNPPALLGTLATIEAGLVAMNAPTGGSGVAAAAVEIAKHMSV